MQEKLINKEICEYKITLEDDETMYFYPKQLNPEFGGAIAFGHPTDNISVVYFKDEKSVLNYSINNVCLFNVSYKIVKK